MKTSSISVRDYLRMIFRRKWALVVPTLGGLLLVGPLWMAIAPKYRAVALVRRRDLAVLRGTPASLVSRRGPTASIDALRVEILTWNNLDRVIRQTNLDVGLQTPEQWQAMYEKLRASISIRAAAQGRGIDLIQIAVMDTDPALAANIANAVADNYVEASKKTGRVDTQSVVKFLQDGSEEYLKKLRETEASLDDYKKTHFTDLPSVKDNILSRVFSLRTEAEVQELELEKAKSRLEKLNEQLTQVPRTVKGEVTTEANPVAAEIQNRLAERERLLRAMLVKYTEEHPDVKLLKQEIEDLKHQKEQTPPRLEGIEREVINPEYQELQMQKRKLEQDIQAHQVALSQIDSRIAAHEKELRDVVTEEKRYRDILRDETEASDLYRQYRRSLVAARTRLDIESGQYGTDVEMLARALTPHMPYQLERMKIALASILGGLCLGVALMFGLEFCDRSFKGIEDAASFLKIPVLGSIPRIVDPQEVSRRRHRRFAVAGVTVGLLVAVVAGLFVVDYLQPGTVGTVRDQLSKLSNQLYGVITTLKQRLL